MHPIDQPTLPEAPGSPAASTVRRLQRRRSYPSVSLLAPRSGRLDIDRTTLRRMVGEVEERLALEFEPDEVSTYLESLGEVIDQLDGSGAGSWAVFVSDEVADLQVLDVAVRERVVIDETFATRDMVLELGRRPTYWVLTLGDARTRLFSGRGPNLDEVVGSGFPLLRDEEEPRAARPASDRAVRAAQLDAYARRVESLLGDHVDDGADQVLVAGQTRRLAAVMARSGVARRCGARLAVNLELEPVHELAQRVAPEVDIMIAVHNERAITAVGDAMGSGRGVQGLDGCWSAAHEGRVELLVAERGYEVAVMLADDGIGFERVEDAAAPRVTDDLVDELIELVQAKGGEVVIVDDAKLAGEGVAAALRY